MYYWLIFYVDYVNYRNSKKTEKLIFNWVKKQIYLTFISKMKHII